MVLELPEFEAVDMFVPEDGECLEQAISLVSRSGKEPIYNCPLMLAADRNPHAMEAGIRELTLEAAKRHVDRAKRLQAAKMVVASGADPGPELREVQTGYFIGYLVELCRYAGPELVLLIEPFDRSIGKNLLIGPTAEAVAVVEAVQHRGVPNIGLLTDMGHVPLMLETFEHAMSTAMPHVRHVHLGSCYMLDPTDPMYGDMHPPWGYPGGANDVGELVEFLRTLFQTGYLGNGSGTRPTVSFEMRPYPGESETGSMSVFLDKLEEAWSRLDVEALLAQRRPII